MLTRPKLMEPVQIERAISFILRSRLRPRGNTHSPTPASRPGQATTRGVPMPPAKKTKTTKTKATKTKKSAAKNQPAKLARYQRKRDFDKTPEPSGEHPTPS